MTGPVPANCSACGTRIPPGATRCPACGRVFGEVNRCPSCHAIAAVRQTDDGFACAACGAPRDYVPGMQVMGGPPVFLSRANPQTTWAKSVAVSGGAFGLRLVSIAVGSASLLLGGIVAVVSGSGVGLGVGGLVALVGIGVSGLLFSLGGKASRSAERMSSSADELEILGLADKFGGSLFATDVARSLGISVAEAEARLSALQDGTRVVAEVTAEGLIRFDFRELRARVPARPVRIAGPEEAEVVEVAATESAEKKETR